MSRAWIGVGLVAGTGILAAGAAGADAPGGPPHVWARWEQTLTSTRAYANPYAEVVLRVTYSGPDGRVLRAYGFWDGGDTFRVRCAFPAPGLWRWETECSDAANAGLHRQQGTVEVSTYAGPNPLYSHGFLKVSDNRRYHPNAGASGREAGLAVGRAARLRLDLRAASGLLTPEWFRAEDGASQDGPPVAAGALVELRSPWPGHDVVRRLRRQTDRAAVRPGADVAVPATVPTVGPGETASFPTEWQSADGRTVHLVFSGDDSFSVRRTTLLPRREGPAMPSTKQGTTP